MCLAVGKKCLEYNFSKQIFFKYPRIVDVIALKFYQMFSFEMEVTETAVHVKYRRFLCKLKFEYILILKLVIHPDFLLRSLV